VVYHNDALARERKLSPGERLLFHQANSGPTMEELPRDGNYRETLERMEHVQTPPEESRQEG